MLALKPSETITLRDGRSLVGFALFAPFATFLLDQGPSTLLMSAAAVVAALLALQRLADEELAQAQHSEWIRAKVAAARADTRPTLTTDEVRANLKARYERLRDASR